MNDSNNQPKKIANKTPFLHRLFISEFTSGSLTYWVMKNAKFFLITLIGLSTTYSDFLYPEIIPKNLIIFFQIGGWGLICLNMLAWSVKSIFPALLLFFTLIVVLTMLGIAPWLVRSLVVLLATCLAIRTMTAPGTPGD
jgi:hypothetical protein